MLKKPVLGALLLAGAAGGPYVLYETDAGSLRGRQPLRCWVALRPLKPRLPVG